MGLAVGRESLLVLMADDTGPDGANIVLVAHLVYLDVHQHFIHNMFLDARFLVGNFINIFSCNRR